jgi:hypothetical protein
MRATGATHDNCVIGEPDSSPSASLRAVHLDQPLAEKVPIVGSLLQFSSGTVQPLPRVGRLV